MIINTARASAIASMGSGRWGAFPKIMITKPGEGGRVS
jgi:hypothetical protein